MTLEEKLSYLNHQLENIHDNYADSFKIDIQIYLGDFNSSNQNLKFLSDLSSRLEIVNWINKLTSRIVLKFDEESESLNDFINDYVELG